MNTIKLPAGEKYQGIAVSPDATLFALSNFNHNRVELFSLPDGVLIRYIGESLGLRKPQKLCFSPDGTILLADFENKRVVELSITGECVRIIGEGIVPEDDGEVCSVATNGSILAYGLYKTNACDGPKVYLFDLSTGAFLHSFGSGGALGDAAGLRFSPDGKYIYAAQYGAKAIAKFTIAGESVESWSGKTGQISSDPLDVDFSSNGEMIIPTSNGGGVVAIDASGTRRQVFKVDGMGVIIALAVRNHQLFVLENKAPRVFVLE